MPACPFSHLHPDHRGPKSAAREVCLRTHPQLICTHTQSPSCSRHLELCPDHGEAKFWVAAITGDASAAAATPPDLVASLFDQCKWLGGWM